MQNPRGRDFRDPGVMGVAGTGFEPPRDFTRKSGYQPQGGAESGAVCEWAERGVQNIAAIDAGLVAVIQTWPNLPEAIRAGILAMVRATS